MPDRSKNFEEGKCEEKLSGEALCAASKTDLLRKTAGVVGEARGKVILFGEHSVVYGYPAIAAPLARTVRVKLTRSETGQNCVRNAEKDALLAGAVMRCLERFGFSGIEASFSGNLPMSVGLGSSAALAVALVRACAQASGGGRSDDFLLNAAMAVEKEFHGNPSGLDHTVSFTEKIIRFVRGASFSEVRLPIPLAAVVWVVSPRGSAKERIAHIGEMAASDPKRVDGIFRDIGRISEEAVSCLQSGAYCVAGRLMDCNHQRLSELGLSTPALNEACAKLREAGAWGAKLTGAGGGGAVVALCQNADDVLRHLGSAASEAAFPVRWMP